MITIALDEKGDFEGVKQKIEPVYIAGIMYDDLNDPTDTENERKRIAAYYKEIIKTAAYKSSYKADFQYAQSLHSGNDNHYNSCVVAPVKELVSRTIGEFIKKGTFQSYFLKDPQTGQSLGKRTGHYHLFAVLKSNTGIKKRLANNANFLAQDDFASNLYFHMVSSLLFKLIFYNPVIDNIESINLELATRSSGNLSASDRLYLQYEKLGYKRIKRDNGFYSFPLTNADVYRSLLTEMITETEKTTIRVNSFKSLPIMYDKPENMEFLFMADSICSVLSNQAKSDGKDDWLLSLSEKAKNLTGNTNDLIFEYGEIDLYYEKAWKKYEEGDYYRSLSYMFEALQNPDENTSFYKDKWFKELKERIILDGKTNIPAFDMAVRKLHETLNNNDLKVDKELYILNVLLQCAPDIEANFHSFESRRILYMLYDSSVSLYCHTGDGKTAEQYFNKCLSYFDLVSIDDFLNTCNRLVVLKCDNFALSDALTISEKNVEAQEWQAELRAEFLRRYPEVQSLSESNISMGKALSQRGQVYAFLRDPKAEREFRHALDMFVRGSANYKITQSYLLHYYLDNGMRQEYCVEAENYFGNAKALTDQLHYIMAEGVKHDSLISFGYSLYVFVKGLYLFRLAELTKQDWQTLKKLEETARKNGTSFGFTTHPAELIYKYLALISIHMKEKNNVSKYTGLLNERVKVPDSTIQAIKLFGAIETADALKDIKERDKCIKHLWSFLKDHYPSLNCTDDCNTVEEQYQWLSDHITYMYR